jgi:hypothetical protein
MNKLTRAYVEAPVTLRLPLEGFEDLHATVDKVRSTSKTVTVNADHLRKLLADHSTIIALVSDGVRDP